MQKIIEGKLKILIVDDDEVDRLAFKRIISKINKNIEVFEALDGFETLKLLKEEKFDCIFLDYGLPQWDGLRVLKEIRNLQILTPVVIITGQGDENLVVELLKIGAEDYLPKSIMSSESVLKSLEYAIKSNRAKEDLKWLASFPERSPIPIIELNYGGEITYINPIAKDLFPDLKDKIFSHPFLAGIIEMVAEATHKGNLPVIREIEIEEKYYHQTISIVPEKNLIRIYAIDITDRKVVEKELFYNAFFDRLTGLFNKPFFLQRISYVMGLAKKMADYKYAILLLNIDRFKVLNDSLGHSAGDKLLISIANRLKESLEPQHTISRFAGDEFGILLEDIKDEFTYVIKTIENIQRNLSNQFKINSSDVFITASIGIVFGSEDYSSPEDIIRDADTVLHKAKSIGRAKYEFFNKEMHQKAMQILNLETDLRRAIDKNELEIYYQPIIHLESGKMAGLEALVRWKHPEKGVLLPEDFLPLAEETGLIIPIDRWVLKNTFFQVKNWIKEYKINSSFFVSINLSSGNFVEPGFIKFIESLLKEFNFPSQLIRLEITENTLISNIMLANLILKELREKGIQIHLDDFGTGYSSLKYLQKFKVDIIKIDKSFIEGLGKIEESNEIVKMIILLAQNLKIDVLAEGIETKYQFEFLKNLKCQYGQGFLFSKAIEPEKICKFFLS